MTYPPGTLSAQLATLAAVGATPDELREIATRVRRLEQFIAKIGSGATAEEAPPPIDLRSVAVAGCA
ncbi:MAG: hypothetical protein P4L90_25925 [Rhodopila sp.]|nr:hypothetical protein [Rhodopila sp.]